MAGMGPPPKPAHLRQRTNKKAGADTLTAPENPDVPPIPNPDEREWHPLTVGDWRDWWTSEMSTKWLPTDVGGLGMLAVVVDNFHKTGNVNFLPEIRLQRQCFGLTPLDRSRLQWEVSRGAEAEARTRRKEEKPPAVVGDPRKLLKAVK